MEAFISSGDTPAADHGGGPQSSEPAPQSSEPAAASSGPDEVEVVPRAELALQKKSKLREEKVLRVKNETRKSKPVAASAPSWRFFECYVKGNLREFAICKLCIEQQEFERAEIKYSLSPSNLLRHLNTEFPGHRDAYEVCTARKGKAPASSVAASSSGQQHAAGIASYFGKDTTSWHQELVRWMVMNAIPFSMLEDVYFRKMVYAIRASARIPDKKSCVTTMRDVKKNMMEKIALMLKGEHVCITSDGWTSCANDTYSSLTVSLITSTWKLVTLSMDCSKSEGTTTGDALAEGIKAAVAKHDLVGKVTAITTDCEPSMVKMGRLLEEGSVCTHVGCCNHRLESTTSIVFNGPGVKKVMALARGLVTRYTTSSQAADRLAQFVKIYLHQEHMKVIQDVVTRWSSTCAMVGRLLMLRVPIAKHEEADKLEPLLAAADWEVLGMILPVLEPFMLTQTLLEGRKYVTGSLVVPFIYDLRVNLEEALDDLNDLPASNDAAVTTARAAVMPCIVALHADFINRWGDGSNILTYAEGNRRQPRGFKPVQVLATALDPRTKMLYGINDHEKADVWKRVQEEAVKIALQNRQEKSSGGVSSPHPPASAPSTAAGASASSKKRSRGGGFMAAAQSAGSAPVQQVGSSVDDSTTSLILNSVRLEVEAYQAAPGIKMYEEGKDGSESSREYLDPLDFWRVRSADFPHLASLARRVLAIPATQAESERLFSCAGNIVTKNRNKLAPATVELLVLLRHSWAIVEDWEKSNAAATTAGRGGSA